MPNNLQTSGRSSTLNSVRTFWMVLADATIEFDFCRSNPLFVSTDISMLSSGISLVTSSINFASLHHALNLISRINYLAGRTKSSSAINSSNWSSSGLASSIRSSAVCASSSACPGSSPFQRPAISSCCVMNCLRSPTVVRYPISLQRLKEITANAGLLSDVS